MPVNQLWEDIPIPGFEELAIGPSARSSDPWTSHRAALLNFEGRRTQRAQVFDVMVDHARHGQGVTADEVQAITHIRHDVVSRRITDLRQMGVVHATRERRQTRGGVPAIVWMVEAEWITRALQSRLKKPEDA